MFPDLNIHSRTKNSRYDSKVAFITGGNVGVGFALAAKLLARNVKVYISCNSRSRLQRVIAKLKTIFPKGDIHPLIIDLTNPVIIIERAREFLKLEKQLDYLILTETCMPVKFSTRFYSILWDCLLHGSFHRFLSTGRNHPGGQLPFDQPIGTKTAQGFGYIFSKHILGNFILIQELKNLLTQVGHNSLILWNGSVFSCKESFNWDDALCINTTDPYGATKYLLDILSLSINDQFPNNCQSFVGCPGFYLTSQSHVLLRLLEPLFLILSYSFPAIHVFGCRASNIFLKIIQEYDALDPTKKYVLKRDNVIVPGYFVDLNKKEGDRLYIYLMNLYTAFSSLHDNGDIVSDGIFKDLDTSVKLISKQLRLTKKQ